MGTGEGQEVGIFIVSTFTCFAWIHVDVVGHFVGELAREQIIDAISARTIVRQIYGFIDGISMAFMNYYQGK